MQFLQGKIFGKPFQKSQPKIAPPAFLKMLMRRVTFTKPRAQELHQSQPNGLHGGPLPVISKVTTRFSWGEISSSYLMIFSAIDRGYYHRLKARLTPTCTKRSFGYSPAPTTCNPFFGFSWKLEHMVRKKNKQQVSWSRLTQRIEPW